jgi:hypothetical protein
MSVPLSVPLELIRPGCAVDWEFFIPYGAGPIDSNCRGISLRSIMSFCSFEQDAVSFTTVTVVNSDLITIEPHVYFTSVLLGDIIRVEDQFLSLSHRPILLTTDSPLSYATKALSL